MKQKISDEEYEARFKEIRKETARKAKLEYSKRYAPIWRAKNKEKMREYYREYYRKHADAINERRRQLYKERKLKQTTE